MRKSLFAGIVIALAMVSAMAHGPPSALDSSVMAQIGISPSIGSGSGDIVSNGGGSGSITVMHGGVSGGVKQMSGPVGRGIIPRNERMLN